jgi:hypothetical protein
LFVPPPNRLLRISYRRLSATLDRELSECTPRLIPDIRVSRLSKYDTSFKDSSPARPRKASAIWSNPWLSVRSSLTKTRLLSVTVSMLLKELAPPAP